jgi:hypothetical protein
MIPAESDLSCDSVLLDEGHRGGAAFEAWQVPLEYGYAERMDLCERIGVDDYAAGRVVTRIVHGPLMASAALETRFMTLLESWTGGSL